MILIIFADMPSVLSDKGIAFIDPHMQYFKKLDQYGRQTTEPTSSFLFHLERDKEMIARLHHQFEPFLQELFGSSRETFSQGQFKGTIFRFPLRSSRTQSDLCSTVYDAKKVKNLVQSLNADAHHMLLFLKNLESIEVFEKKSPTYRHPQQLLDIRISQPFLEALNIQRQDLQVKMRQRTTNWNQKDSFKSTYSLAVEVMNYDGEKSVTSSTQWIVSQYHAGKEDCAGYAHAIDGELGYLPIVGTAINVEEKNEDLCLMEPRGHIFCFLPLPLEKKSPTGLRFHVHGYFAIDQNRRHVKWPTADQTGKLNDSSLLWNQFLVNAVLPKAMLEMASFIIKLQQNDGSIVRMIPAEMNATVRKKLEYNPQFLARLVYAILPDLTTVTPQWKILIDVYVREMSSSRRILFYSEPTDRWSHWEDMIFDNLNHNDEHSQVVRRVLHEGGSNIAFVPAYVTKLLPQQAVSVDAKHVSRSLRKVQERISLSDEDRSGLLAYLIDNLTNLEELLNLDLLPLDDGKWTKFKPASQTVEVVYIGSAQHPQSLLPGLRRKFVVAERLGKKCTEIMSELNHLINVINNNHIFRTPASDLCRMILLNSLWF